MRGKVARAWAWVRVSGRGAVMAVMAAKEEEEVNWELRVYL